MRFSGNKYKYSSAEIGKLKMQNYAIQIKQDDTDQMSTTNKLVDQKFGINGPMERCETCQQTLECPGHFGYIRLAEPVFHMGYMDTVVNILNCICIHCGQLRTQDDQSSGMEQEIEVKRTVPKSFTKAKLSKLAQTLQNIQECQSCKRPHPTRIQKDDKYGYILKISKILEDSQPKGQKKEYREELEAKQVKEILQKISDQDARSIGFCIDFRDEIRRKKGIQIDYEKKLIKEDARFNMNRPEDLIITNLLVPPPQVRPSVARPGEQKSHDDLTNAYKYVIERNIEIERNKNADDVQSQIRFMQSIIMRLMDNEKDRLEALQVGKAQKVVKSIKQRLRGKEGRFRQHLMGKRVDFSARSVVSPDSNLALDELGVPKNIADFITIPEQVTEQNQEHIIQLCRENKVKYIMRPSQEKKTYETWDMDGFTGDSDEQLRERLSFGVIVERTLKDGDYVLFNRQPTLHKMSMMAHRVRILPFSSFRLNLSVTTPYNADFDGDEMNMHVPQNYDTRAELKYICHVPRQVVTPQANKPVMGIVQDALLGTCLITLRDTFLTKEQVMNLIMWVPDWQGHIPMPAILKPEPLWTGKQIISLIIPEKITMSRRKIKQVDGKSIINWSDSTDEDVFIKEGELLCGVMNKDIVGDGQGGLVHNIWLDLGPDECCQFMTSTQLIVNNWLVINGHSIGCSDIVPDEQFKVMVEDNIQKADIEYKKYFKVFQDETENTKDDLHKVGKKIFDSFEFKINSVLNGIIKKVGDEAATQIQFTENNFYKMVWAKSKGNFTNISQVTGIVGQQNIEGARIKFGFNHRTLPHFRKDDNGPDSRGFVKTNYFKGLNPNEFFFHTMGGREGLSDTAVKTSKTGYLQRKLVKALQDVISRYDGTVRDSLGNIIQTSYGEDGLAGEFVEHQVCAAIYDDQAKLSKKFKWSEKSDNNKYEQNFFTEPVYQQIEDQRKLLEDEIDDIQKAREEILKMIYNTKLETIYLPVNIDRLIEGARQKKHDKSDLSPLYVIEQRKNLFQDLENEMGQRSQIDSLQYFENFLTLRLASKEICFENKLSQDGFNDLISEIKNKYIKSLTHPGQAVGAIAAQSIGEPTTQMTLNTFHFAGVSDRNVTLGVPRLQEILDASTRIKTPSCIIIRDKDSIDQEMMGCQSDVQQKNKQLDISASIQFLLPQMFLKNFILETEILFDSKPGPKQTNLYNIYDVQNQIQIDFSDDDDDDNESDYGLGKFALVIVLDLDQLKIQQEYREIIKSQITNDNEKFYRLELESQDYKKMYLISWAKLSQFGALINELDPESQQQIDDQKAQQMANKHLYWIMMQERNRLLGNFKLLGIEGISQVYNQNDKFDFFDNQKQMLIRKNATDPEKRNTRTIYETDGTNLRAILCQKYVNPMETYSNDVMEIARVLGIEAARQSLLNEIREVFSKYSIYINYRHLSILVDWMTTRGQIIPINRNGINRIPNISALRQASFEETVEILYSASMFSELDELQGISENIMFGNQCRVGTGIFDLVIDKKRAKDPKFVPEAWNNHEIQVQPQSSGSRHYGNSGATPFVSNTPHYTNHGDASIRMNNTPGPGGAGSFTPVTGIRVPPSPHSHQAYSPFYVLNPNNNEASNYSPNNDSSSNYSSNLSSPIGSNSQSPNKTPSSPSYANSPVPGSSSPYQNSSLHQSGSPNNNSSSPKYYSPSHSASSPSYQQPGSSHLSNYTPGSGSGLHSGSPNYNNNKSSPHSSGYPASSTPHYSNTPRQHIALPKPAEDKHSDDSKSSDSD